MDFMVETRNILLGGNFWNASYFIIFIILKSGLFIELACQKPYCCSRHRPISKSGFVLFSYPFFLLSIYFLVIIIFS